MIPTGQMRPSESGTLGSCVFAAYLPKYFPPRYSNASAVCAANRAFPPCDFGTGARGATALSSRLVVDAVWEDEDDVYEIREHIPYKHFGDVVMMMMCTTLITLEALKEVRSIKLANLLAEQMQVIPPARHPARVDNDSSAPRSRR